MKLLTCKKIIVKEARDMKFIKKLFTDNNADVNLERMVAIAIAFVADSLILLIKTLLSGSLHSIFLYFDFNSLSLSVLLNKNA